jgi:hypothetical protein
MSGEKVGRGQDFSKTESGSVAATTTTTTQNINRKRNYSTTKLN